MVERFRHRSNCLFGAVKLTKNAAPEKYEYSC